MFMIALETFYKSPADTTGVVLCHPSPALSMFVKIMSKFVILRVNGLLSKSASTASSVDDGDSHRIQFWWKNLNQQTGAIIEETK